MNLETIQESATNKADNPMEKGGTVDEKVPTVFVAALTAGNLETTEII